MITPHAVVLALGEDDAGDLPAPAVLPLGGATLLQRLLGVLAEVGTARPVVLIDARHAEEIPRATGDRATVVVSPAVSGSPALHRLTALRRAATYLPDDDAPVLVHDVARALTPVETVREVLAGLTEDVDAVVPGIAVTDSVKHISTDPTHGLRNVGRDGLTALQSPRLLRRGVLREVLTGSGADGRPGTSGRSGPTADADGGPDDEILRAQELGHRVRVVHGSHRGGAIDDRLSLWRAQIALGLARDTTPR